MMLALKNQLLVAAMLASSACAFVAPSTSSSTLTTTLYSSMPPDGDGRRYGTDPLTGRRYQPLGRTTSDQQQLDAMDPSIPPPPEDMRRGGPVNVGPDILGGNFRVESTRPAVVQGAGSRRTYETSFHDKSNVVLESDGRPVYADVEVWQGPDNTPAAMRLYSEDGNMRPWTAGFQNTDRSGGSSVMDVRNSGPMEFPVVSSVEGIIDGTKGAPVGRKRSSSSSVVDGVSYSSHPTEQRLSQTVQGESLKTFSFGPGVAAVRVELASEGRPMYAQVELWDGPNNIRQCAEVYSDNGTDRTWSAIIPTPGYTSTIAIRNTGPMVYPIESTVEPLV